MSDLPKSWVIAKIKEIADLSNTKSTEGRTPYLEIGNIDTKTKTYELTDKQSVKGCRQAYSGDVLVSRVRPTRGAIVKIKEYDMPVSSAFSVLRDYQALSDGYLFNYLAWNRDFLNYLGENCTGTMYPTTSDEMVGEYEIAIAPRNEQEKIVSKIEELFSEIDAGTEALKRVEANLKRYQASVLKAACEGKLVPTEAELAKKEGREYEHASVLLERILKERKEKWEKENPGKKYKEPKVPDTSELPKLPEGWVWTSAEQISEFITKGTTPNANKLFANKGDVPFIKVYNLTFTGALDFSVDPTFVSNETSSIELKRSRLIPGDILMNIVGPPLGKVSVVPDLYKEWNMNQAVVRFRPLSQVDKSYFKNLLLSEVILSRATSRVKATAGQFNLTLEICRDLPIPLPPYSEQVRIAHETDNHISLADKLVSFCNTSEIKAPSLRQSILKKAFSGQLAPQDIDDEPASVLLERIKVERAKREEEQKAKNRSITRKPKVNKKKHEY